MGNKFVFDYNGLPDITPTFSPTDMDVRPEVIAAYIRDLHIYTEYVFDHRKVEEAEGYDTSTDDEQEAYFNALYAAVDAPRRFFLADFTSNYMKGLHYLRDTIYSGSDEIYSGAGQDDEIWSNEVIYKMRLSVDYLGTLDSSERYSNYSLLQDFDLEDVRESIESTRGTQHLRTFILELIENSRTDFVIEALKTKELSGNTEKLALDYLRSVDTHGLPQLSDSWLKKTYGV